MTDLKIVREGGSTLLYSDGKWVGVARTHALPAHADDALTEMFLTGLHVKVIRSGDEKVLSYPPFSRAAYGDGEVPGVDLVFDEGGGEFDHHTPGSQESAVSLFLKKIGLWDAACIALPGLEYVPERDNVGPFAFAKAHGVPDAGLLASPMAEVFLKHFPWGKLWIDGPCDYGPFMDCERLKPICRALVSRILEVDKYLGEIREIPTTASDAVKVFDARELSEGAKALATPAVVGRLCGSGILISPNREPGKLSLTRLNDCAGVNFAPAKGWEGVSFVHPNGFLAVVADGDDALVKRCVAAATVAAGKPGP